MSVEGFTSAFPPLTLRAGLSPRRPARPFFLSNLRLSRYIGGLAVIKVMAFIRRLPGMTPDTVKKIAEIALKIFPQGT